MECTAEEEAAKLPAEGGEQQQKETEQWKFEDAPDGKFEDFVAVGVRTAELVAAGARAASRRRRCARTLPRWRR